MANAAQRLIEPVRRRLRLMVSRAVVRLVNDSLKVQGLQITLLAGEVASEVERFGEYGLSSVPEAGAEAIALAVGASRDHLVVLGVEDRRYRPTGLKGGEVQLYSRHGQKVYLREDGGLELTAPGEIKLQSDHGQVVTLAAGGKATVVAPGGVEMDGGTGSPQGVVQAQCVCAFTGAPHPEVSSNVKGSK